MRHRLHGLHEFLMNTIFYSYEHKSHELHKLFVGFEIFVFAHLRISAHSAGHITFACLINQLAKEISSDVISIWQTASAKLQTPENQSDEILQMLSAKLEEWCNTPPRASRRISSSANTASSCHPRTTSSNTCWRTSRKRSLGS